MVEDKIEYNRQIRYAHERAAHPELSQCECALNAGYAETTAAKRAYTIEALPHVQEIIKKMSQKALKQAQVDTDKIIKQYSNIAFAKITDFLKYETIEIPNGTDKDGNTIYKTEQVLTTKPSDEVDGSMISEVSIGKDGTFRFKLRDGENALNKLAQINGLLIDKKELTGKDGEPLSVNFPISRPQRTKDDGPGE